MSDGTAALAAARASGFRSPPRRAIDVPLIDVHTHISRAQVAELLQAAARYGIRKILGIGPLEDGLRVRDRYPDSVLIATQIDWEPRKDPGAFARVNDALLRRAAGHGVGVVKLWFGPRIYPRHEGLRLDAPLLDPVFDAIAALGMRVLVHIADPDIWFATKYTDTATYGTKAEQYPQLETRLRRYRTIPFLVPHMGGDPEHLDHLGALLDDHPNLSLDTSATRWIVRELGRQPEAARAFFARYADRLLWGSDQVVLDEPDQERYDVRYWIHQVFWETDIVCPLPIEDPDAGPDAMVRGIALGAEVLRRVYWENAARWLGLPTGP